MRTAVASADDEGPKKKFGIGLPKKPSKGTFGLSDSDRGIGLPERKKPMYVETKKKAKKAYAGAGANPDDPKGPKVNNKMKVVPLKEKTLKDQEMQKAKAKESLKKKSSANTKPKGKGKK